MQGKIVFYNEEKGYGFLDPGDGGGNLFFHATGIDTSEGFPLLCPGDAVEFTMGSNRKGPCAENVRKLPKQRQ